MKEIIIKRCLSVKSNRVQLLIPKKVYTVSQSIKSVIKKEKEDSRTQRFLYLFTQQTGYVQSLTHSKDSLKRSTDQVYNTCPQQEYTALVATTAEPTAVQETTQSQLCVSRTPLLKPTTSHSYTESTV